MREINLHYVIIVLFRTLLMMTRRIACINHDEKHFFLKHQLNRKENQTRNKFQFPMIKNNKKKSVSEFNQSFSVFIYMRKAKIEHFGNFSSLNERFDCSTMYISRLEYYIFSDILPRQISIQLMCLKGKKPFFQTSRNFE